MNVLLRWCLILATLSLCGCLQIEDELTIQPDGSGTVRLTVQSSIPEQANAMFGGAAGFMGSEGAIYPPVDESEVSRFFPPKDFITKSESKHSNDTTITTIEASFKDINKLLASPYARAHQLSVKIENNLLKVQALTGAETVARVADIKPEGEMAMAAQMPGFADLQKKKSELKVKFSVTLPNAAKAGTGVVNGKSVTWSMERAKAKDDPEFIGQVSAVLEATCDATGIKFAPVTPVRLGLVSFQDLVPGKTASVTRIPDTNKVLATAKFIPYSLNVTRALDLSGEGYGNQSQAQLFGGLLLPAEYVPQRWGEVKLLEAVDGKGNNLMPNQKEGRFFSHSSFGSYRTRMETAGEESETGEDNKPTGPKPFPVSFSFNSPLWKVKEIGKIRGTVELLYLGGSDVLKLSNAVPASLVKDVTQLSAMVDANFVSGADRGKINDARLAELGLSLRVQMAMAQSGVTIISLEISGSKSALVDAQVFDADGKPWPTMFQQPDTSGRDEVSCQIVVYGKPKPPLSMAFVAGGIGASVKVPVLLENIPVDAK